MDAVQHLGSMSEGASHLTRFREEMEWYRARFTEQRLVSANGAPLRVAMPGGGIGQAVLVVVGGRTEFLEKYLELARDLHHEDISLCLYDHCGQGGSGRLLADRQKGHIDRFSTYVDDLQRVIDAVSGRDPRVSVQLLSHSMGGTIAALLALRRPEQLAKMVLASPMCGIRTGVPLPDFLVRAAAAAACKAGLGEAYVATSGPYEAAQPFAGNLFTGDEARFSYNRFLTSRLDHAPLGGPTYRWLHEAFLAMRAMRRGAARIGVPMLVLAARGDRVVPLRAARKFAAAAPDCRCREYPVAGHELFMERDQVRTEVIERVRAFLQGPA